MLPAIDGLGAVSLIDWWPVRGAVLAVTVLTVLLVLRYARRVTSILLAAVLLAGLMAANLMLAENAYNGSYPTVSALNRAPVRPKLPDPPATGTPTSLDIPGTQSGFAARPAHLYLPHAAATAVAPLPVLVLLHDAGGAPQDWLDRGTAGQAVDAWVARTGGVAPILVMPDAGGDGTVCGGGVETYLTRDVPEAVRARFATASPGIGWAVAGHGAGGTCALTLALRHPDVFGTFADFGGAPALPALAPDPAVLLRDAGRPGMGGWFAAGAADPAASFVSVLFLEAQQAGFDACLAVRRDEGPGYETSSRAFADALPWLLARVNQAPTAELKRSCTATTP